MHWEPQGNAIRTRVETEVQDALGLPVLFDNEGEDIPALTRWGRCWVDHEAVERLGVAQSTRYKFSGNLRIRFHDQLKDGDGGTRAALSTAKAAFHGVQAGGVTYGAAVQTGAGENMGRWFTELTVPFFSHYSQRGIQGTGVTESLTPETVGNHIRSWMQTKVSTPQSFTTLFDNDKRPRPEVGKWGRFTIFEGGGLPTQKGATPGFRTSGIAMFQIFDTLENGVLNVLDIADATAAAFVAVRINGILFLTPRLRVIGRDAEESFWQSNLILPFLY